MIRLFFPLLMVLAVLSIPASAPAQTSRQTMSAVQAIATAERLAAWQLGRLSGTPDIARVTDQTKSPRAWEQAVFWVGMTALAEHTASPRWREAIFAMGRSNGWTLGPRPYHADDHVIGQTYLWAARNGAGPAASAPTRKGMDFIIRNPAVVSLAFYQPVKGSDDVECLTRWCWCDALFMAPATLLELSRQTGDRRYRDFAIREFWKTTDFLYDPVEHLYYRDSRFFERRDEQGRKQFWSRGNGWVFAGLARIIPLLPKVDPERRRFETLYRDMAAKLVTLQKQDGYWAPSLLGAKDSPPESSGTGFYTFGLAWGVKAGLLDRATYEPAARKGWAALERSIQPDGRLGWVQQVSDRPEIVRPQDTQFYGVGAFLLAATAIADLDTLGSGARR